MLDTEDLDFDFFDDDFVIEDDEPDERFAPIPYANNQTKKRLAVVDCETDPFAPYFLIKPFAVGFWTEDRYVEFWGPNCVDDFFEYLATLEDEYIIYAHNGGKFDFFFFLKYLDHKHAPMIMNGRLVKLFFQGQEFRDSYAFCPEALASYQKEKIDYAKFAADKREKHKVEILRYLRSDCQYLFDLVIFFHNRFGDKLTIASASMAMLQSYHGFEKIHSDKIDEMFRHYYYGGRNQCFETGILKPRNGGTWKMVDRNSMYPSVMRDCEHPISSTYELTDRITDRTDFACIFAENNGALPLRAHNGGLDFTCKRGIFYASIHEIRAGLETGTLKILAVKHAWEFEEKRSFGEFINTFYESRLEAKAQGDRLRDLFDKRVMNSSYGKFALNPRKFKKWLMTQGEIPDPIATETNPDGWSLHSSSGDIYIWERPNPRKGGFYNVATASSITGAARANLLTNLSYAERPIYCDTDSIICEEFHGECHETQLGGWKVEAEGDLAAIAGKKLYAVFNQGDVLKKASKGANLTPAEIVSVCNGETVIYENPVPAFHLHDKGKGGQLGDGIGSASFITRQIKMTGGNNANRNR